MKEKKPIPITCQICGRTVSRSELMPAEAVRNSIAELIRKRHSNWSRTGYICLTDLNRFRAEYIEDLLEAEKGEFSSLEAEVVDSLKQHEFLSSNINVEFEKALTLGERLADKIASFGGSWTFILTFGAVLVVWIGINSVMLLRKPFDPFPFILLNLVLSCLAAIQAPIIMMSQNRLESRDRLRSENDYQINLKAELEIRQLHEKLDHLLSHQWQRLIEIQQVQIDLMEEVAKRSGSGTES
ncbi:MAG: DUF1003 domain-containing protein [Candidatus Tectomicrobia bacterium]|uniref:DUF1003 domain-containing protein n=1 Tax=Tectimicrobiota bacterium TaxID=2528274 RepID=A0A932GNW9_UNCTE|nr:DUF1003 domain-containing protein [Candidatus Tectomicrobia bacterium]